MQHILHKRFITWAIIQYLASNRVLKMDSSTRQDRLVHRGSSILVRSPKINLHKILPIFYNFWHFFKLETFQLIHIDQSSNSKNYLLEKFFLAISFFFLLLKNSEEKSNEHVSLKELHVLLVCALQLSPNCDNGVLLKHTHN